MNAIYEKYDKFIKSHPQDMRDAILFLESQMEKRDCMFGNQIVPAFLKPVFLHENQVETLSNILLHSLNILEKVTQLYFSDPELREYYYLDTKGAELIEIDHGYDRNIVICRPDSFLLENDHFRFVEFNCDSPAGPGYADVEEDIMKETFPLKSLESHYSWKPAHRSEMLLAALLSAYQDFAGSHAKPNIAIMDWKEVRTLNEFRILQKCFRQKGFDTIIVDPRDLKFINGKLEYKGFVINLIYRRAIFRELMERFDQIQDFIKAYRNNKVCVVNPFRSRLASNKAILSIITNQKKYKQFFSEEERHIIHKHIPWTRRVKDIQTHLGDNLVFLRKYIMNHKDQLVLKPSDSYGGKDVVIGNECPQVEWEVLLNRIIVNKEDWVVQRYVNITQMTVPIMKNKQIHFVTKKYNINPFVFNRQYAGSIARLSDRSVINVSAGGGMVPVMSYKNQLDH